jgi:hypothetical protein
LSIQGGSNGPQFRTHGRLRRGSLLTVGSVLAAQFGTAEEAKALLEKAVAAVKQDKGEGARDVQYR